MTTPAPTQLAVSRQGYYAGAITRLAAYAVDQAVLTTVFTIIVVFVRYSIDLVSPTQEPIQVHPLIVGIAYGFWWFVYFAAPWALSGKTLGMALLGIRVVRSDGSPLEGGRAFLRAATLPLGFVTFGLGFVGIVVGRAHRAWHDRIAGSAVVYDWDARAAQLRFLAAPAPVVPAATSADTDAS